MPSDTDQKMQDLAKQEQDLSFTKFCTFDAIAIGMKMVERAKSEGTNITVQISMNHKTLFHISMDGCSPDVGIWVRRKENMVYRFHQSSFLTVKSCENMGASIFDFFALDKNDFVAAPGGFPIKIKGVGCVGAICCGGMMPLDDHQYIIQAITDHLGN